MEVGRSLMYFLVLIFCHRTFCVNPVELEVKRLLDIESKESIDLLEIFMDEEFEDQV